MIESRCLPSANFSFLSGSLALFAGLGKDGSKFLNKGKRGLGLSIEYGNENSAIEGSGWRPGNEELGAVLFTIKAGR